jgi:hypothetical protein
MSLQSFKGYNGVATLVRVDGAEMFLLAGTIEELEAAFTKVNADGEFNPEKCKPAILVNPDLFHE